MAPFLLLAANSEVDRYLIRKRGWWRMDWTPLEEWRWPNSSWPPSSKIWTPTKVERGESLTPYFEKILGHDEAIPRKSLMQGLEA